MARRSLKTGTIKDVSGEVIIAGGDIYKGYTPEQVSVLLAQITSTFQPKPYDGRCPYKGLDDFEEEDAELFFGRERLVEGLVGRLNSSRILFITGPSGSGKSSLVRAGLIPAWKRGALKALHSERWCYETMKPGREPLEALALAFSRLKSPDLANYFRGHVHEKNVLHECAESVLSGRKDQRFLLFVDQFEEIFTQINREEERLAFLNLFTHAVNLEKGRVILVFAMRSDFVSNCAAYPELNALLNQQSAFAQIGSMRPEELVSAIAQPALRVGLRVDPHLAAQIINDMQGEPGALPLMQFALKDLFDAQQAKGGLIALTLEDYLRHGGIHKALERHADSAFAKLSESEQALARSIFGGLIEIGRGTQDTRRTALFDELVPANIKSEEVLTVVQKLADARLIITDEQAGVDTVTISHEKLIDAWPWLRKLVNENREAIALQNEIAADAKEWYDHQRDPSYLYTGARLASAREQLDAKKIVLGGLAQQFIEAGVKAYADELEAAQQRAARLRRQTLFLSGALIVALVAVGLAVFFGVKSQGQVRIALARQLAAQAQSLNATRNSKQMTAVLLATQSMKMVPSSEAAQVLLNNNFATSLVVRMTHDDNVYTVAFSPDGKYIVSGSEDNTARVWEAATGEEGARLPNDGFVISAAFSPDGNYVVTKSWNTLVHVWEAATGKEVAWIPRGDADVSAFSPDGKYAVSADFGNTARVWEVSTGKEVAQLTHDGAVTSLAFSPDGKYVASGSDDKTARVWEAATGKEVVRLTHDDNVYTVAFSPDGRYVFTGSSDAIAHVWEVVTGTEVSHLAHDGLLRAIAFSPDDKYVISGGTDNIARVWETDTGREVARMTHDANISSVAFSPDGRYVVSGSEDNTARMWEADTGREVARMTHEGPVNSVTFSPDGKYAMSGSSDNTIRIWKAAVSREAIRLTHDGSVSSVAFSPDGRYVITMQDTTIRVWEAATGEEVARLAHDSTVVSAVFSPDGKYVVSGGYDNAARVWETVTGKEVAFMAHEGPVISVAFSPDGQYVASGGYDKTARVWEISTGKEVSRLFHDGIVVSVAFSPDGKYVASGSWDTTVRVWEALTGKEVLRLAHDNILLSVAFSPDGKYVVSGSSDKTARVWEIATGKEVARLTHEDAVVPTAFSPDSRYVVTGSRDGIARVWEVYTGKEVARMPHDSSILSVAFSPDGKYVVSGGDTSARVWEVLTGKEVARLTHEDTVVSAAFSPDGRYVISGSEDGTARIWIWQPNDLIANACMYLPRNLTRGEWNQYIGDALPYQAVCPNLPIEP